MRQTVSLINEKLFSSKEISGIGAARILKGKAARILNFFGRSFAYSSTRSYGCFMLSFGLVSLLLNLGEYYFADEADVALSLVIGLILTCLSVPLLIFDKPMCIALQDISVTDYLLYEFFAIKRLHRNVNHPTVSPLLAVFLGFIPAVVGFFLPVQWVALAIVVFVVTVVAFTTPEFSLILMLICLPYIPALPSVVGRIVIVSLAVVTLLSFALKVAIGKRVYNFDIYDVLVILLMLVIFAGGIAGYGSDSMGNALLKIVLLLGYFPIANLITNRRLADCAINAVIVSSIPVTVLAIVEFFTKLGTESEVSVFFDSSSVLAAYLLVSAILSLSFFVQKKNKLKKSAYITFFALELFVLGLVMQPAAWLAMLLAGVACFIISSRKIPMDIMLWLFVLPHLALLIPTEMLDAISNICRMPHSFSEKLSSYEGALSVFLENVWLGVGIGSESYDIASGGAPRIFNNLLGIGVELGVIALSLFLLAIVIRLRHISYYRTYVRASLVKVSDETTLITLLALLVFGVDAYIFSDTTVFCLFWAMFGICTATLRSAKREYDERLSYYGDSSSAEYSVIDVQIQK